MLFKSKRIFLFASVCLLAMTVTSCNQAPDFCDCADNSALVGSLNHDTSLLVKCTEYSANIEKSEDAEEQMLEWMGEDGAQCMADAMAKALEELKNM